jgi:Family of unknown function (DUF6220)
MVGRARQAYLGLGILFNVGVVVQFFLAGLGIFGAESFAAHRDLGNVLHLATVLLLILALVGRIGRRDVLLTLGLVVLVTVQIALPETRDDAPGIAAFHPVLALAILGLMANLVKSVNETRVATTGEPVTASLDQA